MNLPNYFIADQPPEATITPSIVIEACQTLKRNRTRYLLDRSTESLIQTFHDLAKSWLEPDFPFRKRALELGPTMLGFPTAVLNHGLDQFFSQITRRNLESLILQEVGHHHRLDKFSSSYFEEQAERASMARGPELIAQITGGVLPNPALTSIILGFLVRSAQFIKCAQSTSLLPRLFAHSLYEVEPKLGACLEIAEWKGGTRELEQALFAEADCVTATGSNKTLEDIKHRLPEKTRFLGYGHRVSFGYVARELLSGESLHETVRDAVKDVSAWNQLGCLSPHVIYVETGGVVTPERFSEMLAEALEQHEEKHPRGEIQIEESAAISYRRSFYEIRATATETRIWQSKSSTAWTVIYENDPQFQVSCLNRFIYVKAVASLTHALQGADSVHGKVSTVGLAATRRRVETLAHELAQWGATRICHLGQMQNPPITWRHDGRPALGDLVTWTDWEM